MIIRKADLCNGSCIHLWVDLPYDCMNEVVRPKYMIGYYWIDKNPGRVEKIISL